MRQYDDLIDVRRGIVAGHDAPEQFVWRGRLWVVREIIAHWVRTGAWWEQSEARDLLAESEVWRVEAGRGKATGRRRLRPRVRLGRRALAARLQHRLMDPFVHLHVASGYSLKYGASHPRDLAQRAAEAEMDALALTDRDGVYGAVRFAKACQAAGIRPILGVDLAVEPRVVTARPDRRDHSTGLEPTRCAGRVSPARGGGYLDHDRAFPRVTLLAGSKAGWAALCRLVSATHLRGERGVPVATRDLVADHLAGLGSGTDLLVMLGPSSELGWAAALRRDDLARAVLRDWYDVTDRDNLLVEVMSHRRGGIGPGSSPHAARMAGVATAAGHRLVLTNEVRYVDRADAPVVDVLDATRRLVPLDLRHVDRANAEGFLKTGKEMADIADEICRFAGLGDREAERLLAGTRAVADRCALDPRADLGIGEVHFPESSSTSPGSRLPSGRRGCPATRCCASAARRASGGASGPAPTSPPYRPASTTSWR